MLWLLSCVGGIVSYVYRSVLIAYGCSYKFMGCVLEKDDEKIVRRKRNKQNFANWNFGYLLKFYIY